MRKASDITSYVIYYYTLSRRVHISATTLSYLNGEFEVEPAYGEKRDEALRIAGLKTYFIVKVLKPFEPSDKLQNGDTNNVVRDGGSSVISEMKIIIDEKNVILGFFGSF